MNQSRSLRSIPPAMPAMPAPSPRVFLIRHGETEWSLSGRHTSVTDIQLTARGERRVAATGRALVGEDRLIMTSNLAHVIVSPRRRARATLDLLFAHGLSCASVTVRDDVREWDYGEYEGLTTAEIRFASPGWDIWRDGCPSGESPEQVTQRLDELIAHIRDKYHAPAFAAAEDHTQDDRAPPPAPPSDVLIVAHGHILRALAMRWIGAELATGPKLLLEPGGVGTLSYEHGRMEEPAILLGGGAFHG